MFDDITVDSIRTDILNRIQATDGSTLSVTEGSVLWHTVSAISWRIWQTYQSMNALIPIAYVDETSGVYLDKRCGEVGITRKPGAKATCSVLLTGVSGLTVPAGTVFLTASGLSFSLDRSVTLAANGEGTGALTADEPGEAWNIAANSLVAMYTAITGLSGFSNTAASGGADEESDAALYARLREYWLKPVTSGNANEYAAWALSVPGIGYVRVQPLWNGAGTVKVIVADADLQAVDAATVQRCAAYIETVRPIGAAVTVASAAEVTLNVTAEVQSEREASAITADFMPALQNYLTEASREGVVRYNRIMAALMGLEGVEDVSSLTLNSDTENIELAVTEVAAPGEVVITCGS